ncbi:HNH endonuclease [Intrasporangium calvum]|uniref:HNH endonuclease n=1 Tax=Intrasporangium calvum TaxID=53358 RepID=A0ABT5GDY1_9MICO|nr:HNH endonuclease signature motif containing protein [Intrasporangium calvum]MDC5696363.1 HNH endonuclease [Intrasporangium calvum]
MIESVRRPAALAAHDVAPWLSRLAETDGSGLGAADLVDVLDALERAKAACAAAQARVTAAFVDAQAAEAEHWRGQVQERLDANDFEGHRAAKDEVRRRGFTPVPLSSRRPARRAGRGAYDKAGVAAQVGLARHESPRRGAQLATTALALVRDLPCALEALTTGQLNERRAELVARLTSHLSAEDRLAVDAEVVGANLADPVDGATAGIATWGDRQLEGAVRAAADRLDAEGAVARARTAESERRVTIRPIPDTMALVTAVLPVKQAVALYAALTAAASTAHATGDLRSKGQVMADTLVDRVLSGAAAGSGLPGEVPVEVQVVITDRALFDSDDTPAQIPGYGPVPAGWARTLLTEDLGPPGEDESTRPRTWLRRLYTHPATGTLVAMDSRRRLFPAGLRRHLIARDGTCRTPWCDAPIRHADHVTPWAEGGPTTVDNGQGLCERCNHVKEQPGWSHHVDEVAARRGTHAVTVTTPTGHQHSSVAPPVLPGQTGLVTAAGASRLEAALLERLTG